MTTLYGCKLTSLTADDCATVLAAVVGDSAGPDTAMTYRWLLMHCDSGVVWGRFASGKWCLSSEAFPDVSPKISAGNKKSIQQLRLFGGEGETLLWRVNRSSAKFEGRSIVDAPAGEVEAPLVGRMLLLGNRALDRKSGFTLIGDATGACHAVPVDSDERALPLTLFVKHYLESIEPSGSLRIAATRLCHLG